MSPDLVEVEVNNTQLEWYTSRGYAIPHTEVQLWARNGRGERVRNGTKRRVARGTKILVQREDLPPSSNMRLEFQCQSCGGSFFTQWRAHKIKQSQDCKGCESTKVKGTGCHSYWVTRLITNNPNAACDISGERDKRFLVLHHLLSRGSGGKDEESNYVVLSANYHMAFHTWNGGTNAPCDPDGYQRFKLAEVAVL